jgi:hypothetical protein
MHAAPRLSTALIGVALVVGGIVLATDLRGFSTWYATRSIGSVSWAERPLRRIQPWKALLQRPLEERVRRQALLVRVIGAIFALCGVPLLIYGAFGVGHILTN